MPMNEKQRALDLALAQIEKQFGKGAIMKLGEAGAKYAVEVISTGALGVDLALGVGGVPRGRVVEIYGPESSGKTTLGYHIIAEAQRSGGVAAFIDAEHALDPNYAKSVGVNIDNLLLSQALRKLVGAISRSHTTVVFINQIREKLGVMWGSPETTTGGRALKFYASVRMEIRRTESIKIGEEVKGMRARVKIVKNKLASPFRDAEVDIYYGHGISKAASILDVAAAQGITQRTGTWFSYGEMKLGQGRDNARDFLESNPELALEIDRRVRVHVGLTKAAPTSAPARAGQPSREPAKGRA